MSKRKKIKRKTAKVVIHVQGSSNGHYHVLPTLLGQAVIAGFVYAAVRWAKEAPPRRSMVKTALRHPLASIDIAHTAAHNRLLDLRERGIREAARLRNWLRLQKHSENSTARPPSLPAPDR